MTRVNGGLKEADFAAKPQDRKPVLKQSASWNLLHLSGVRYERMAIASLVLPLVLATSRVPPPVPPYVVCVEKEDVCALVHCATHTTSLIRTSVRRGEVLWSIPFAAARAYLSPDGRFLVFSGGEARQRLVRRHTREVALVVFWSAGGVAAKTLFEDVFPMVLDAHDPRRWKLDDSELVPDGKNFLYWGDYMGFNRKGEFEVFLPHQGVMRLDPATGKRIR